jgi:hypothetical protein
LQTYLTLRRKYSRKIIWISNDNALSSIFNWEGLTI